jgi:hypothetical protein
MRTNAGHLRHPKEFCHGVDGRRRAPAPAANLVGVRVAGRPTGGAGYAPGSAMVVLRLDTAFDCRKVIGVGKPKLVEGFCIAVGGDKLRSRIVARANPATWSGVVDTNLVAVSDCVVSRLGPFLGLIALVERVMGVRVGEAFDMNLVGDQILVAVQASDDDGVTIISPWGGPVYCFNRKRQPNRQRWEAINK